MPQKAWRAKRERERESVHVNESQVERGPPGPWANAIAAQRR